jgi:hypothetical protein
MSHAMDLTLKVNAARRALDLIETIRVGILDFANVPVVVCSIGLPMYHFDHTERRIATDGWTAVGRDLEEAMHNLLSMLQYELEIRTPNP